MTLTDVFQAIHAICQWYVYVYIYSMPFFCTFVHADDAQIRRFLAANCGRSNALFQVQMCLLNVSLMHFTRGKYFRSLQAYDRRLWAESSLVHTTENCVTDAASCVFDAETCLPERHQQCWCFES